MTRRQALKAAAGTSLLVLLPMLAAHADPAVPDQWVAAGKSEDFVKKQPMLVTLKDGSVLWITRLTPTLVTAVSAKCTHKGCQVGWDKDNTQFLCPCHGAVFQTDGKNVHGTQNHPDDPLPALLSVPSREKDGQVEVNVAVIPAGAAQPRKYG